MSADNFLGLPQPYSTFEAAQALVLPIPLEATVTFGAGTAAGPAAIIAASQHVELYDREHDREPALDYGVHTLAPLELSADPAEAVERIAEAVGRAAATGKLVVCLGGEHTISAGVTRGLLEALGGPLTVVQLDAHCDLRDEWDGTPYSHACVVRRILDDERVEQVLQLGIRSIDSEEVRFRRANPERVHTWYAEDVHAGGWREQLARLVEGRRVHVTIDVDGLDPSVVPATGTPEPDGLSWTEALEILRTTAGVADVAGIDCVELAPQAGQHAADFAVAKLVYKALTYAMERRAGAAR